MQNKMIRNKETVCAVVVTYNRKTLLLECLEALLKQIRPIDAIYIIDNYSNDGTPELLFENRYIQELPPANLKEPWEKEFTVKNLTNGDVVKLHYVRMKENTGSAGGFYEGIRRGYAAGYDWLWLMDDDTIPYEDSLEKLIEKFNICPDIGLICSKVVWLDGSVHIMNVPSVKNIYGQSPMQVPFNLFDNQGVLIVESCSFVSALINRKAIKDVGYPIKEFFIWYDDVEYTSRISAKYKALYARDSIVLHKTVLNQGWLPVDISRPKHYFYAFRNQTYVQRKRGIKYLILFAMRSLLTVMRECKNLPSYKSRLIFLKTFIHGTLWGLIFNPTIDKPSNI